MTDQLTTQNLTYPNFSFNIHFQSPSTRARLGTLNTPHGAVETPAFIFCATKAAIKGLSPAQMESCGTQFILANTYHLMLSPGSKLVQKMGGLHQFMGWKGPMLTDSGGFQVFSLGHGSVASEIKGRRLGGRRKTLLNITEAGAEFKSYLDGSNHLLTPEKSILTQRELGPDLVVVFDECTPFHVEKAYTEASMHRSHRWEVRSLQEFTKHHDGTQALYGIVQGGVYEDLRREATDFVNSQPFFGHAVGGSLGADKEQMYEVVSYTMARLNPDRPVHLLGIGGIRDIFEGVKNGIDTFDCVHPTRLARHGGALIRAAQNLDTTKEHINLKNKQFQEDSSPIDETCPCETCRTYSRAYLHYLFKARELLALQAVTVHNVTYMNRLLEDIRHGIKTDTLAQVQQQWIHTP
jgi:tRNA-guanine transglycosylase (EC 2.4.2.29)